MRKVMIFQHIGHEILGTLNPILKDAGFRIRYVNFDRHPDTHPTVDNYNGLIVLGGPMGVHEVYRHPHLLVELKAIETALKKNIPVLGICLGAQLLAKVLGAEVRPSAHKEFGWYNVKLTESGTKDPLFEAWKPEERIFQAHQDGFAIPESAEHLASSALCEGQAFRYGEKVYGLQFHLEVDQAMVHRWLRVPQNRDLIIASNGKFNPEEIEEETEKCIERSLQLSHQTFTRFVEMFNLRTRPMLLGSGHGKPRKHGH